MAAKIIDFNKPYKLTEKEVVEDALLALDHALQILEREEMIENLFDNHGYVKIVDIYKRMGALKIDVMGIAMDKLGR